MSTPTTVVDLVESIRGTLKRWAVLRLTAALTSAGFGWLMLPFLAPITCAAISWLVDEIVDSAEMKAMIVNTAINKLEDAEEYVLSVENRVSLDKNSSIEEIKNAERRELVAFRNLVIWMRD